MKLHLLPSLLSLAATVLAIPTSHLHVVHEERFTFVTDTKTRTRVHRDAIIPLRIGLKQSNLDQGYTHLMEISDPESLWYGQHWSVEKVFSTYSPSIESVENIRRWLVAFTGKQDHEIVQSFNRGWIAVDLPAWQAESLMRTEFYEYYDPEDDTTRLGCE
jgi:tripeptidyl-peptidase I